MQQKRFKDKIKDKSGFVVIMELTSGPDFSFAPIDRFLQSYQAAKPDFKSNGFDFVGITSTDNSVGTPNIEPVDMLSHIKSRGLLGDLDFIPHISCKDKNSDALVSSLAGFKAMEVESMLIVTGDKPVRGKGVFELDSINLLQLIKRINVNEYLKSSPNALDNVPQFFPGAAVSPFKYTEASQMQQYYKMEKKIACGAEFLITQVGWDWKKSVELFRYLKENNVDIPVIGDVLLLSTTNPLPRLMHDLKLPGCFVSDEFFAKLSSESYDEHIERCAQQVAMYKSIGAAGVDIGSVHDFDVFTRILQRASEIGTDWEQYRDNLCWPKKDGFYLYNESGQHISLSKPKQKFKHKFFDIFHRHLFEPESLGFRAAGKAMSVLGAKKNKGFVYNSFAAFEYAFKHMMFECDMCGDCYLPENFSLCTIGGCEKKLSNAPCGDATADGLCGNNLEIACIGERIYNAAASVPGGIDKLRKLINEPRIHSLEQTSSILNDWFGRDHNAKPSFISIGELINSLVPRTGRIMKHLHEIGADAYSKHGGHLNYVLAMIDSQALACADYIAVNLDAFNNNRRQAADMIIEYVRLIQKYGHHVPICIDSSDNKVLIDGLKKWYDTGSPVRPPLLSSIKQDKMDGILAMRKDYDFGVVVLLHDNEQHSGLSGKEEVERLYLSAGKIFEKAVVDYGFKPKEVFFELEACPLASDLQKSDNNHGCTHVMFESAKKIINDRKMSGVHCLMRPSMACNTLKRSIGITRAYVSKAFEYGFDSLFVNVALQYGSIEPDAELIKLVDAFIKIDGSPEHKEAAAAQIKDFLKD
ncbi:MAG: methylenetetrahydrofolate reductase C-terminal domain-containing protein [Sedimentisphaerales bacterium]|nr:methylenetetrahydrofolate reductase C-terminal domain-containing protein [Sedimentisphaerales bacterium]